MITTRTLNIFLSLTFLSFNSFASPCLSNNNSTVRYEKIIKLITQKNYNNKLKLYVSTGGSDEFNGLSPVVKNNGSGPFATIIKARDKIRELKRNGNFPKYGVIVYIEKGLYEINKTIEFYEVDSGMPGADVVYASYGNKKVRLVGGHVIKDFHKASTDFAKKMFSSSSLKNIYQINLRANGIKNFGKFSSIGFAKNKKISMLELFINEQPMTIARWPNDYWLRTGDIIGDDYITDKAGVQRGKRAFAFKYKNTEPEKWFRDTDIWLHGYWYNNWADDYIRLISINKKSKYIIVDDDTTFGFKSGQRYRYINVPEELDMPTEWYLDHDSGYLYFWPPITYLKPEVIVSTLRTPLIRIRNTKYIQFNGITFEIGRSDGIDVYSGENINITNCIISDFSGNGIFISGGKNNYIQSCIITNNGEDGIKIRSGNRKKLIRSHNVIEYNVITNNARWKRTYSPGIDIHGVGVTVRNNSIINAPHSGLILKGNDHLVEYNEFGNLCYETSDTGALYTGRDWSMRGNIIRYNFFHKLHGFEGDCKAIYLDDLASGYHIYGNIFYDVDTGIFIGGGRDNLIKYNILSNCKIGIHVDSRGLTWAKKRIEKQRGSWDLYKKLRQISFDKPPYSINYKNLSRILTDSPLEPRNNHVEYNMFSCTMNKQIRFGLHKNNWVSFKKNLWYAKSKQLITQVKEKLKINHINHTNLKNNFKTSLRKIGACVSSIH